MIYYDKLDTEMKNTNYAYLKIPVPFSKVDDYFVRRYVFVHKGHRYKYASGSGLFLGSMLNNLHSFLSIRKKMRKE